MSNACTNFRLGPRVGVSRTRYAFKPPRSAMMMSEHAVIRNRKDRQLVRSRSKSGADGVGKQRAIFRAHLARDFLLAPAAPLASAASDLYFDPQQSSLSRHHKIPAPS